MRQGRKESTAVALRLKPKSTYMWTQFYYVDGVTNVVYI
jgi:hypothetical protein